MKKQNTRKKKKLTIPSIILLLIVIVASSLLIDEKLGEPRSEPEISGNTTPADTMLVTVDEFINRDTARFNYEASSDIFRYLMIDTLETKHSRHGEVPFGSEAAERTRELLQDAEKIEVEFDAGPAQD